MSNISPSGGGNSPPRLQRVLLSVDKTPLKAKRKIDDISLNTDLGSSSASSSQVQRIEESSKLQKIGETSSSISEKGELIKLLDNIYNIAPLLQSLEASTTEQELYNNTIERLIRKKDIFIDSILATLPKLSTVDEENKTHLINLYKNTFYLAVKKFISERPDFSLNTPIEKILIKKVEEDLKKGIITQSAQEKTSIFSDVEKIKILFKFKINEKFMSVINQNQANIFEQFFPTNDRKYEKDKKEGKHLPVNYNLLKDSVINPDNINVSQHMLKNLLEYGNPEIRNIFLNETKFFPDDQINDGFIFKLLEIYQDTPVMLARILQNQRKLSSNEEQHFELLNGILENMSQQITVNYERIIMNPKVKCNIQEYSDVMVQYAQYNKLSEDNKVHKKCLAQLIRLGRELDDISKNPNLLITLIMRTDLSENKYLTERVSDALNRPNYSTEYLSKLAKYDNFDMSKALVQRKNLPNLVLLELVASRHAEIRDTAERILEEQNIMYVPS